MHIDVDRDKCQQHGQCVYAAPDVFEFDVAGNLSFIAFPDDSQQAEVDDAIDQCPVMAIRLADDT